MNPIDVRIFDTVRQSHSDLYTDISELRRTLTNNVVPTTEQLADTAYAVSEAWKLIDDMRKEMNKLKDQLAQLTCAAWVQTSIDGEPIRTEYVTCSPHLEQCAKLPTKKSDPAGYAELMDFMGVPPALYDGGQDDEDGEAIRPHWPGMLKLLTRRAELGLPLPPGIRLDTAYPVYSLRLRGRKGVME